MMNYISPDGNAPEERITCCSICQKPAQAAPQRQTSAGKKFTPFYCNNTQCKSYKIYLKPRLDCVNKPINGCNRPTLQAENGYVYIHCHICLSLSLAEKSDLKFKSQF